MIETRDTDELGNPLVVASAMSDPTVQKGVKYTLYALAGSVLA